MCFAVFGFNFLFFVLVLSSNNGWYQFRRRVSVVGLIHCPLLWAWEFLSDLRSPPEFGTLSTISVCLRVCLNLCTYMKSFWCLFRRRSWKTTMPGSWTHWRASNRPIRVQRKLWVQKRWKLDLTNSLFNLSWKIQRCRLAPVWSVVPYLCSLNDHYNITSIVVIFLWGGGGFRYLQWSETFQLPRGKFWHWNLNVYYGWKWGYPWFGCYCVGESVVFHYLYYGESSY